MQTAATNNFASDTRFPQSISGHRLNTNTKSDYDLSQQQTADRTSDGTFNSSTYPSFMCSSNKSNTISNDPMMDVDSSMASSDVEGCCPSLDARHFSASTCSREVTKMDTSQSGGSAVVTAMTTDAPSAMTADVESEVDILLSSSQPTTTAMTLAAKALASQPSSMSVHMAEPPVDNPLAAPPPLPPPPPPPPPPPLPVPSSSAPTPASLMMTDDDFVELLPESLAQHLPSRNSEGVVLRRQQQQQQQLQQQQQQKRPMHRSQSDVTYLRTRSRTNSSELFGLGLGLGIGVTSGGGIGNTLSMSSTTSSPRSSTSRLSHASAELERFFNEMGIDRTILEPMLREHEDSVKKEKQNEKMREREKERERESDFLETLSSLDSPDTRSICSGGLSYSEKGQTESGVDRPDGQISNSNSASASASAAATPSGQTTNTSIVERNARIIKWLCNVKKARSPSTN